MISNEIEKERERISEAYWRVFTTESGKAVLADILDACGFDDNGIEKPSFEKGMTFEAVARNEGAKEVARRILRMVRGKIEAFKAKE